MGAAVDFPLLALGPVSEDTAPALAAGRGEGVGGAFERIEMIGRTVHRDFERIAIGISATVACFHNSGVWELGLADELTLFFKTGVDFRHG